MRTHRSLFYSFSSRGEETHKSARHFEQLFSHKLALRRQPEGSTITTVALCSFKMEKIVHQWKAKNQCFFNFNFFFTSQSIDRSFRISPFEKFQKTLLYEQWTFLVPKAAIKKTVKIARFSSFSSNFCYIWWFLWVLQHIWHSPFWKVIKYCQKCLEKMK